MSRKFFSDDGVRIAAGRLRVAVIVVMVLVAAALALAWTGDRFGSARVEMRDHVAGGVVDPLIGATVAIAFAEIALLQLVRMLAAIAAGESFSVRVIGHFRSFAFWLMLMALAELALPLVASLAGFGPDGVGNARFAFVIDLGSVIMVGVTFLLFLLARLLERARLIEEEIREIV